MRIAIIGYGKMGKAIEAIALERGHEIIILNGSEAPDFLQKNTADVAVEFTGPESAAENIKRCISAGIPVVCGTTGWLAEKNSIEEFCKTHQGSFFYASNFSLGVNLFFRLNAILARMMAGNEHYKSSVTEIHHTQKKDAPSGTAITLAEGIVSNNPRLTGWAAVPLNGHFPEHGETGILQVISERADPFPGKHTVRYTCEEDEISITHEAFSRKGFAAGAVAVAEWLPGRTGVFGMDDFLKF
jgi:4-hydroxy-tetrahydrodipicolinate reductase